MLGVGKSRKKRRLLRRLPSLLSSAYEGRSGAHKALHLIARLCALLWMCGYMFEDRCAVFVTYT